MEKPYLVWKKSIEGKLKYEKLLKEEAIKVIKCSGYKPKIKIGKKNIYLFEKYIKEEKEDRKRGQKRRKRRR